METTIGRTADGPGLELLPLGDAAVLVRVGDAVDAATHARVRAVCAALERAPLSGVLQLVPAYAAVAVHYDPAAFADAAAGPRASGLADPSAAAAASPYARVAAMLEARLVHELAGVVAEPPPGRLVEVPVVYGGPSGPDLDDVARHAGMTADEVIRVHAGAEYHVYMIGFAPGFPYLAGLPAALAMPRRDSPRVAVPAGSVGIGGAQTGIYPQTSPGGWRLIGRTDARLFRPDADPPTLLELGDRVRFVPVSGT